MNLSILFFAVLCVCNTLNYEDSIKAILYNQVEPNDDTQGTVWFNCTGYELLDYGFKGEDVGIKTYSSFKYLRALTSLAQEAANRGYHGDVVFLYYKFLYGGQHQSTEDANSDIMQDIAQLFQDPEGVKINRQLYEILTSSTSSDHVLRVFQIAYGDDPVDPFDTKDNSADKHWIKSFSNLYAYVLCQISSLGRFWG